VITVYQPGTFQPDNHWYPKALNATMHPMVNFFLNLSKEKIISRYCHLNPLVDADGLRDILDYQSKHFIWSGADLFNATTAEGNKQMVVIENNSCPSGQKSMPLFDDNQELGSYKLLIERTFMPLISKKRRQEGNNGIAVFYDKNAMETTGYAQVIANVSKQKVYLVEYYNDRRNDHVKIEDGYFYIKDGDEWVQLHTIFRYVTQNPWSRFPLHTKTKVLNPIVACLAGGRNKMVAAKAYDLYNAELAPLGLKISTPETIWDLSKAEIPMWVEKMGGHAVIKNPYSNAGQGVYTITNQKELQDFMDLDNKYDRFIIQSLIGNHNWSSHQQEGKYYHVGTMPDNEGKTYVADIRMMVSNTQDGIKPLCIYSRRALEPLVKDLDDNQDSWGILGTNLSVKLGENKWESETNRLMLMDRRDFNKLGLGLDDLIGAYIQTVLSTIAIDKMCIKLFNSKKQFRMKLFKSLNNDETLLNEILL